MSKKVTIIAFIILAFWGVAMSFMIPTWQTPDENTHVKLIGNELGNDHLYKTLFDDFSLDRHRVMSDYSEKVNVEEWKEGLTKEPGYTMDDCAAEGLSIRFVRHIPQAAGMYLGIALHLPTYWVLQMGEFFALAFFLVIGIISIKIMPVHKEILLMFMAIPMVIQQVSSINYDCVLLPLSFLFIAFIFHLRHKEGNIRWRDLGIILLLSILLFLCKEPYLLMIFFTCLLPKEKFDLKLGKLRINENAIKRFRIPVLITIVVLVGIGVVAMQNKIEYADLLVNLFRSPRSTLNLFGNTFGMFTVNGLTTAVGCFGWLDSTLPLWFIGIIYVSIIGMAITGKRDVMKWSTRIFTWVMSGIMLLLIVASMIVFTRDQIYPGADLFFAVRNLPYIGGVQGRYMLPFIPFAILVLPKFNIKRTGWRGWFVIGFIVACMIATLLTVGDRYWA